MIPMKKLLYISLFSMFSCFSFAAGDPVVMKWKIGGIDRQALIYAPANAKQIPTPIVFVFHGHGGNMYQVMRGHPFSELWPEAIIVSPQGLNTPGQLTDPQGKLPGWQSTQGNMGDRDLLFFDAMIQSLKEQYKVDDKRIYATGHSNGGGFTYLLVEARNDVLAAAAPSAAADIRGIRNLKPKPILHIIGERDPLVKPEWQEMTYKAMMRINNCSSQGKPYATDATIFESTSGNPVIIYKHSGGHTYPTESVNVVINFFKSIAKR